MTLAVTGTTGRLGGLVARSLADLDPVLVVRDPTRAPQLGGEVRQAEYADATAARSALDGVTTLFMVSAAEAADRRTHHRSFIGAAADAGVRHVVYTSFFGAAPDCTFTLGRDHADAEAAVRERGMAWTFLRDNFYADELSRFADREGVIRGPAGDGRVSLVAIADVAAVAAEVLRDPAAHAGVTYELTGPEALTLAEVAAHLTAAFGTAHRFEDETVEDAYASRRAAYGAPPWQLDAWVSTYTAIADGSVARVTDDVERVTGRRALTFEQTIRG